MKELDDLRERVARIEVRLEEAVAQCERVCCVYEDELDESMRKGGAINPGFVAKRLSRYKGRAVTEEEAREWWNDRLRKQRG